MNAAPIIEIEKLSFSYGGPLIQEDVDLAMAPDEFLGLVGPNGGGKSTLLKLILGLLEPTAGSLRVFGRPPRQGRSRIGYVPQYSGFDRDFPICVEKVVLQGRLDGRLRPGRLGAADRRAAEEAMEGTQVTDLRRERIGELSGGQLQRVLLARALAGRPELLMLDEPTANIDSRVEGDIFELLRRLNERMGILVVSHDLGFISRYVTRVACLNRGLVCHETSAVGAEILEKLYGPGMRLIDHGSHLDPRETP